MATIEVHYSPTRYEKEAYDWFLKQGDQRYADEISALYADADEHIAEAEPDGPVCPFLQDTLDGIYKAIREVYRRANAASMAALVKDDVR